MRAIGTFTIEIEKRPCMVEGFGRALLHCFGFTAYTHPGGLTIGSLPPGQESSPNAVVEFEDGTVKAVPVNRVRMLDSREVFEEFAFSEEGAQ